MRASTRGNKQNYLGRNREPLHLMDTNQTYPGHNKSRIYNVQTNTQNTSIDKQFNNEYGKKGIQPTLNRKKEANNRKVSRVETQPQTRPQKTIAPASSQRFGRRRAERKKNKLAVKMAARMRVSGVNSVIFGVGTTLWLTVQLPLAVLNTVLFGMALALYSLVEYAPETNPDDGIFTTSFKYLAGLVVSGVRGLASILSDISIGLFGFNILSLFDPLTFFMITYMVLFAISLVLIFTMYTAYKLMRLKPLSGKGTGLKYGTLMLAMIGYSIPLANMFPWFMVWAGAVWLKPK